MNLVIGLILMKKNGNIDIRTFPPLPPNQISLVPIFTSTKFITKL